MAQLETVLISEVENMNSFQKEGPLSEIYLIYVVCISNKYDRCESYTGNKTTPTAVARQSFSNYGGSHRTGNRSARIREKY